MIPDDLLESATFYWQADGQRWCENLPGQIEFFLERWKCEFEATLQGASTAYVARVRREDGSRAVLKITYPEIHGEFEALVAYESRLAVEAFEGEDTALLIEWCNSGTKLRDVASADEAFTVTLDLMYELWATRPFLGIDNLVDQCSRYVAVGLETLRVRPEIATPDILLGLSILEQLGGMHTPGVLLHGDLHPGNILRSARRPWLVIDPKPLYGDPAFETIPLILEVAPTLGTHSGQGEINARIEVVASRIGLSAKRIAQWGAARRCDWALFCHRAHETAKAERAERELHLFISAIDEFDGAASG